MISSRCVNSPSQEPNGNRNARIWHDFGLLLERMCKIARTGVWWLSIFLGWMAGLQAKNGLKQGSPILLLYVPSRYKLNLPTVSKYLRDLLFYRQVEIQLAVAPPTLVESRKQQFSNGYGRYSTTVCNSFRRRLNL